MNTDLIVDDPTRTSPVSAAPHPSGEALLQSVLDSLPALVCYLDTGLLYLQANRAYADWFGVPQSSLPGRHLADVIGTAFQEVEPRLRAVLAGNPQRFEVQTPTAAGVRYLSVRQVPHTGPSGEVVGVIIQASDITHRKEIELSLERSREQLELTLEAAGMALWSFDPARNVVTGDSNMAALFGISAGEAPAAAWINAIHPDDRERVAAEFAASISGAPYDTEYRVVTPSGDRWVHARAQVTGAPGEPLRMIGVCEDATARKLAQSTLQATNERLRLAQRAGNIATWDWDLLSGTFVWDREGALVYGRPIDDLDHIDDILTCIHPDDRDTLQHSLAPVLEGQGEFNQEFRVLWPDGSIHWLIGRGLSLTDPAGRPVRLIGMNLDITDRRHTEAALRQSEKLAAVGQLASTIAHEINNPLESVTNLLYLARLQAEQPTTQDYLETADRELRRIAAITSQTLHFHKQLSRPSAVFCEDLFRSSLLIYQGRILNASLDVQKRKRATIPVTCMEGEIRQVLNNLIGNAIDAMKTGGTLFVRSAHAHNWHTGQPGLRLTVADTGHGMTPSTLQQIFHPFFTTKGINGTGLGLWVSREIIDRHHGTLRVRSCTCPGRSGTVFTLFLPFDALGSTAALYPAVPTSA